MLFEHRLGVLHSRKTNLWSCKSTNRGFLKAIFQFWISLRRHLEMWRVMAVVPGPLALSYIVLGKRRPGTAAITRHISRWRRREIQNWKIAFRKPRLVDLQDQRFVFLLYNTPNLCSKSILGQLVETTEDSFKDISATISITCHYCGIIIFSDIPLSEGSKTPTKAFDQRRVIIYIPTPVPVDLAYGYFEDNNFALDVIVQTRVSVLPLICKYRQAGWKYEAQPSFCSQLGSISEDRRALK